ncbi:hypothetical protein EYF80_007427 [Liparis tanakae]|uniref:Uncharacterized protein n=1 Tax=Liparis tanakae TaxID=230148 RepID=A0A4Z2IWQ5_9TELE|nr:hypothetical protein EYF80_007427 [Liparis tanakae]
MKSSWLVGYSVSPGALRVDYVQHVRFDPEAATGRRNVFRNAEIGITVVESRFFQPSIRTFFKVFVEKQSNRARRRQRDKQGAYFQGEEGAQPPHKKKFPGISARSSKDILIPATNWTPAVSDDFLPCAPPALQLAASELRRSRAGGRPQGHSAAGHTAAQQRALHLRTELTPPCRREAGCGFGVLLKDTSAETELWVSWVEVHLKVTQITKDEEEEGDNLAYGLMDKLPLCTAGLSFISPYLTYGFEYRELSCNKGALLLANKK